MDSLFAMLKKSSPTSQVPQWLVVGLGNPGKKYENTRHNAGFRAIDYMVQKAGTSCDRVRFKALTGTGNIGDTSVMFIKPQTYMNLSGESVAEAAKFYKIPADHILVLFDDIYQKPGVLRIRKKGSDGGHNGIKSIVSCIGSSDFPRIKIGVGDRENQQMDLADWVLSSFTQSELQALDRAIVRADEAIQLITKGDFDTAVSRYNGAAPEDK